MRAAPILLARGCFAALDVAHDRVQCLKPETRYCFGSCACSSKPDPSPHRVQAGVRGEDLAREGGVPRDGDPNADLGIHGDEAAAGCRHHARHAREIGADVLILLGSARNDQ